MEIKAFVQALNTLHWKTDYNQFCKVLGFDESRYSREKYEQFEQLCRALNSFDADSLIKLVEAGVMAERK